MQCVLSANPEYESICVMSIRRGTQVRGDRSLTFQVILIGDHHQLPPVVKNQAFQKYSHLDQPLFTRFIRLGVPHVELDAQGRARPGIAKLYNWRYAKLGDLPHVHQLPQFQACNAGFAYDFQFMDVAPYRGRGESEPTPYFFQNEDEAQAVVRIHLYACVSVHIVSVQYKNVTHRMQHDHAQNNN